MIFARLYILLIFCISVQVSGLFAQNTSPSYSQDTILPFPFKDEDDNTPEDISAFSPLFMEYPKNIKSEFSYDPTSRKYKLSKKIGENFQYRRPRSMSFEDYLEYDLEKSIQDYWYERAKEERRQFQLDLLEGVSYKKKLNFMVKLLGKLSIDVSVQGAIELILSANTSIVDNPIIPEENRKRTHFDLDPKIHFNMQGKLGKDFDIDLNFDTESIFNFDKHLNINYKGKEDGIIRNINVGNVSMSLPGTLVPGVHDLFGVKSKLQFGKLFITTVLAQQRSESQQIQLNKGVQTEEFKIPANHYEPNKHFFLSKYFRDNFENALSTSPIINTNIKINKIEVWITNKQSQFQSARNIVAFVDLGENSGNIFNAAFTPTTFGYPSNETNDLYQQMSTSYSNARSIGNTGQVLAAIPAFNQSVDYEKIESARLLNSSEYTLHEQLGYISLKRQLLNDEIIAVAYEYVLNGQVYRVGEFVNDGPNAPDALYLKLIKGTNLSPNFPYWDLMMKNIYRLGVSGFSADNFILDVIYEDNESGGALNYLPESKVEGEPLITVLKMDNLNTQLDPKPDGLFDFIEGITVNSRNGLIIFPQVEPFGEFMKGVISDAALEEKYVYEELYDELNSESLQFSEKNKYYLYGRYRAIQTAGNNIALNNLNTPKGSVTVLAGGVRLVEDIDYRVDYTTGKVQIINPSILESGVPIQIRSEDNSLFNVQSKTMIGNYFEYRFNEDLNIGATLMYLQEKAIYTKANIGQEPFSNFMWGINGYFTKEVPALTKLVNKYPFIDTDAKSQIHVEGEFAQIIPAHNKAIKGRSYLDDFEGTKKFIDLRAPNPWKLASTPQHQPALFPEGNLYNDLAYGYNRAKLAWYLIDPYFYSSSKPSYISANMLSNHSVRYVSELEVFPNVNIPVGSTPLSRILNLAYYPSEKGPYNFDVEGQPGISSGILSGGELKDPQTRWAGIMRNLTINNFETANVEYIEFWMMDPFINNPNHSGGDLYVNLGSISEDILRDSRKSFENGLKTTTNQNSVDTTLWGIVPNTQSLVDGFDIEAIDQQDYGLDGLSSQLETNFFSDYLNRISTNPDLGTSSAAYQNALADPASDDYQYFRSGFFDAEQSSILERYKNYNSPENNSVSDNTAASFTSSYTNEPDREDINNDNTLNETEAYYQYRIPLNPATMDIGQNFISDIRAAEVHLANGETTTVNWFQFRIPITEFEDQFGGISDFSSIRFIRLFLKNFNEPVVLRFIRLNLIRNDWRTYNYSLKDGNEGSAITTNSSIELSSVSIEENSSKQPINYVQPPDIERIQDPNNPEVRYLNEQALAINTENLEENDIRGLFKYFNSDIRFYKHFYMDVHAEAVGTQSLNDDELRLFVRMGNDFIENYYEYEIALKVTPPGVYSNDLISDRREVWPEENRFDFDLKLLTDLKIDRNNTPNFSHSTKYSKTVGELTEDENIHSDDLVSIKGNPTLSDISTIMIGVRNPQDGGGSKSAEIWVNEMRLSEFKDEKGWAANLRTNANLADFGTISIAGNTYTPGFGGISQNITQRALENFFRYDFTGKVQAGKLFPSNWRINLPVYYAISEQKIDPKYQAVLDDDIELKNALSRVSDKNKKKSIKRNSRTYTKNKSFNLTNVQIQKGGKKRRIYDISNFSFTYAYSEDQYFDPYTTLSLTKNYRGGVSYAFSNNAKMIYPFKKWKKLDPNKWKLLKDFNFNFKPTQFTFRSEMTRYYKELIRKNVSRNTNFLIKPTYDKNFKWNRFYSVKFPITRSLNLDFSASSFSTIDEPEGIVDKNKDLDAYKIWKEEVLHNIKNGGRLLNYSHRFSVNYKVPINKIPALNFTNINASYSGDYQWFAPPLTRNDSIKIGNTIINNRTISINGRFDLVRLYNKSNYLARINKNFRRSSKQKERPKPSRERINYEKKIKRLKPNERKLIKHKIGTKQVIVRIYDENNNQLRSFRKESLSENKFRILALKDTLENITVRVSGVRTQKPVYLGKFADSFLQLLMSMKNINFNFSDVRGTTLPGFLPTPTYLGIEDFSNNISPGWGFITGWQDKDFGRKVAGAGLLTTDDLSNNPYLMNASQQFNIRGTLEPIKNFGINIDGYRTYTENFTEYFNYQSGSNSFLWENTQTTGNLFISHIGLKSIFSKIGKTADNTSPYFDKFLESTKTYSQKLAKERYGATYGTEEILDTDGKGTGYYNGYNQLSQDVLIQAFHKTYGRRENRLLPGLTKILPNWSISYGGLSRIKKLNKYITKLNLRHAYRGRYEVGAYSTNLNYAENINGQSVNLDKNDNFLPKNEVASVAFSEAFIPLLGVDISFVNNISAHFAINRQHNLILNFINSQLIETSSNDLTFGSSYRIDDFDFFLKIGSKARRFKNDLTIRGDLSVRNNVQLYRNIVDQTNQLTAGQYNLILKVTADWILNDAVNFKLFYDRTVNRPYVSTAFPTLNSNFGLSVNYRFKSFEKKITFDILDLDIQ